MMHRLDAEKPTAGHVRTVLYLQLRAEQTSACARLWCHCSRRNVLSTFC